MMNLVQTAIVVGTFALALGVSPVRANESAINACRKLERTDFSGIQDAPTQVTDANVVTATSEAPAHCHVQGYVSPQVGFELRLPIATWNGKFIEIGTGGSGGTTRNKGHIQECREMLRRGYACLLQDRGHSTSRTGAGNMGRDYLWAYNNTQAEFDSGIRAAHVAALAGKAVTQYYYGTAPKQSYFMGCSGGGRQAMMEVQRFPWDFEGIIAIDPSANFSSIAMALHWRYLAVTNEDGKPLFTPADLDLWHSGVLAQCDLDDGIKDGVIGYPPACRFDPAELTCKADQQSDCLSHTQSAAVRKLYSGPVTSKGETLFYGSMPGSETSPNFLGMTDIWSQYFRYQGFMPDPGPDWEGTEFDFDKDYKRLGLMGAINDATNPDLRKFKAAGGKLIIAQGWDDSGSPMPLATIDYYEMVEKAMGGRAATQEFARLFMMPGRKHCGSGPGPNAFDFLSYLEDWVEDGRAPDMMIGAHIESDNAADYIKLPKDLGKAKFTRPIYPYPLRYQYEGRGDPDDYRNFEPLRP